MQHGIDVDGALIAGQNRGAGAGQNYGCIQFPYLAGFMLQDAAMLGRSLAVGSNSIGQCFWVTGREIGFPVKWDVGSMGNSRKQVGETYQDSDLDIPEWTHTGWSDYAVQPPDLIGRIDLTNASLYGAYRDSIFTTQVLELLAVALLRNGPGGLTGDAAIRNGSYGPRNIRSAPIAYMDRSVTFTPWAHHGVTGHSSGALALYAAWRDHVPQPRWTGRPDVSMSIDHPEFSAGSAAGEIKFDATGRNYATETVTGRDIGYSQDNLQFVAVAGVGRTHTLKGLRPGTAHHCRWRQRSASGTSRWSPTWQMDLGTTSGAQYRQPRGLVTTPGSAAGALANVVAPAILYKPYSAHEMPYYEPVTDPRSVKTFYAGMGYWAGGTGSLTAAYQWQRNTGGGFADISGQTAQSYDRTTADGGTSIRCVVTVNGKAANSDPVSIPAAPFWPATTLIDTTFDGSLPFEWPKLWSALQSADASNTRVELIHLESVQIGPDLTRGTLRIRKTGANPTLSVEITSSAPSGTYSWEAELGGGYFPHTSVDAMKGDIEFRLRDASGATRGDAAIDISRKDVPTMVAARGTFTIGGADKSVHLYVRVTASVGSYGEALGGAILSKLKIWQQ